MLWTVTVKWKGTWKDQQQGGAEFAMSKIRKEMEVMP